MSTRLLCREEFHKTVEKIETLKKNTDSRVKLDKSLVCYPEDAWDNALYVYDVENKDVYLSLGWWIVEWFDLTLIGFNWIKYILKD